MLRSDLKPLMGNARLVPAGGALVLMLGLCSGCEREGRAPLAAAKADGDEIVTVKVVRPERRALQLTTTQPATVHAYHQAEVYAKLAGYLKELKVDIGDPVQAGQELGIVDVPEMFKAREKQQARIRRLQTDEMRTKANVDLAGATIKAAESFQDQAAADVNKFDAQLNADKAELDRVQDLVASQAVASRLLDEARQRFESSQAAKQAAQAAQRSAVAQVSVATAKLAVAHAEWEAARVESEVAQKELQEMDVLMSYAILKAPFDGVVTQRSVDPGDLVRNIQAVSDNNQRQPLFTIAQIDRVRVRVSIPENEAALCNSGDAATLVLRSLPHRQFPGQVNRVARGLDESTRTMLVEIDLANPEQLLLPGMYGEATIVLFEKSEALLLPATAVRYDENGRSTVYLVDGDGRVRIVEVSTGIDNGKQIEITQGLDADSRVVDAMIGRLATGQQVRVEGE